MIQEQTIVKIGDNSGAKTAKCIRILGGFKKKYARIGDLIIVSIQKLRNKAKNKSKVTKGSVLRALVLYTKIKSRRKDGSSICFRENTVALINKQGSPIGTRVLSPVPCLLKKKKLSKFITLSIGLV